MYKLDYKKVFKQLYNPAENPAIITVPNMRFIMVDGNGDPNDEGGAYQKVVELLFGLSYTIKMGKNRPPDYFEYVVPPLEGLWWYSDGAYYDVSKKADFCWTMMIRQPEFVTTELFESAKLAMKKKKPELNVEIARLNDFEEGLCVQSMHIGPYDDEPKTVEKMDAFARENGLIIDFSDTRRHHEIYLSDPRKVEPSMIKTVLRHPFKKL
jgi:hypothetical protein